MMLQDLQSNKLKKHSTRRKNEKTEGTCFTGFYYPPPAWRHSQLKAGSIFTGDPALHAGGHRFESCTA